MEHSLRIAWPAGQALRRATSSELNASLVALEQIEAEIRGWMKGERGVQGAAWRPGTCWFEASLVTLDGRDLTAYNLVRVIYQIKGVVQSSCDFLENGYLPIRFRHEFPEPFEGFQLPGRAQVCRENTGSGSCAGNCSNWSPIRTHIAPGDSELRQKSAAGDHGCV